jgi:VWFA-related protein
MYLRRVGLALVLTSSAAAGGAGQTPQPQAPAPIFRAETSLVPLDIRVLDRNGKPVAGLKASDFTVVENGVAQSISHFSPVTLEADPPPADALPLRRAVPNDHAPLAPQTRRVFLIVFGRGRLQHPSMGADAALTFVSQRLQPRDQIAIMAYNRATDFTTDRARLTGLVERFRDRHEHIEARLVEYFSGWSAMYKGMILPEDIQREIDSVFEGPLAARELPPGRKPDGTQITADSQRIADSLQRAEILKDRAEALASIGVPGNPFDAVELSLAGMAGMSLPEFVATNRQSLQDLDALYAGIQYLRYIEGEKHLVFVTPQGLNLPRLESDLSVAAAANHARVAIDIIQTGGHRPTMVPAFKVTAGQPTFIPSLTQGEPLFQRFAIRSIHLISELTGGQSSAYAAASQAFDRIERASSTWYLLGYYPTNRLLDGKYRKVTVKVNRPGVTVLYRHGYFAEPARAPIDRRRAMTYSRIASAANYPQEIKDVRFSMKTSVVRGANKVPDFVVDLTIDASTVGFVADGGRQLASLDVAVFCQDDSGEPTGDRWETIDLKVLPETHTRMLKDGITYSGRVTVARPVKFVKVVVYDFGADRVGTLVRQVR